MMMNAEMSPEENAPARGAREKTDSFGQAVEALLFVAESALPAEAVADVIEDVTGRATDAAAVEAAVDRLNGLYAETGRAFRVHFWGGGFRLATTDVAAPFARALVARDNEQRLSRALLETLAIVAYKQPVTKPEVDHVRGVNADYAMRQLLERGFIDVIGRAETVGTPLLYGTTDAFLDLFGLGTLSDLPKPREIEEILADPQFKRERTELMKEVGLSPDPAAESGDPARQRSGGDGGKTAAPIGEASDEGEPPETGDASDPSISSAANMHPPQT